MTAATLRKHAQPLTEAQKKIVADNLPLVQFAVGRMRLFKGERDAAIAGGEDGLFVAARLFDPSLGFRFSTYATRAIWSYAWRAVKKLRLARRRCKNDIDISIDVSVIAATAMAARFDPAEQMDQDDRLAAVAHAFATLQPDQRQVISGRVQGLTLGEIAKLMSLSKERIRQIETKGLLRLRQLVIGGKARPGTSLRGCASRVMTERARQNAVCNARERQKRRDRERGVSAFVCE